MKRNRDSVRDEQRKISVSKLDRDRVNKLLDAIDGEEARLMYRCFLIGLGEIEKDVFESQKTQEVA